MITDTCRDISGYSPRRASNIESVVLVLVLVLVLVPVLVLEHLGGGAALNGVEQCCIA